MRVSSLLGILLLSILAQGQAGITLTFGAKSVTADGVTRGKSAVFFASGLAPDDEQQRVVGDTAVITGVKTTEGAIIASSIRKQ